jgi:hypothetical protein
MSFDIYKGSGYTHIQVGFCWSLALNACPWVVYLWSTYLTCWRLVLEAFPKHTIPKSPYQNQHILIEDCPHAPWVVHE